MTAPPAPPPGVCPRCGRPLTDRPTPDGDRAAHCPVHGRLYPEPPSCRIGQPPPEPDDRADPYAR